MCDIVGVIHLNKCSEIIYNNICKLIKCHDYSFGITIISNDMNQQESSIVTECKACGMLTTINNHEMINSHINHITGMGYISNIFPEQRKQEYLSNLSTNNSNSSIVFTGEIDNISEIINLLKLNDNFNSIENTFLLSLFEQELNNVIVSETNYTAANIDAYDLYLFSYKDYKQLISMAIEKTIQYLKGNYSMIIMSILCPNTLFIVKHNKPIYISKNDEEVIIMSNLESISKHNSNYYTIPDNIVYEISAFVYNYGNKMEIKII